MKDTHSQTRKVTLRRGKWPFPTGKHSFQRGKCQFYGVELKKYEGAAFFFGQMPRSV
jgi:hypothetical protein